MNYESDFSDGFVHVFIRFIVDFGVISWQAVLERQTRQAVAVLYLADRPVAAVPPFWSGSKLDGAGALGGGWCAYTDDAGVAIDGARQRAGADAGTGTEF